MSTNEGTTPRKSQRISRLEDFLSEKAATCQMRSWNDFTAPVTIPPELFPALMTGRPELLEGLKPRALSEDECKSIYELIVTLIKTNMALREHAELLAQSVSTWAGAFRHLEKVGVSIQHFANFRSPDGADGDAM